MHDSLPLDVVSPRSSCSRTPIDTNGAIRVQVAATQHLGFALQFAIEALRFGEGPALASRLAPMLPPLLQLQVGLHKDTTCVQSYLVSPAAAAGVIGKHPLSMSHTMHAGGSTTYCNRKGPPFSCCIGSARVQRAEAHISTLLGCLQGMTTHSSSK